MKSYSVTTLFAIILIFVMYMFTNIQIDSASSFYGVGLENYPPPDPTSISPPYYPVMNVFLPLISGNFLYTSSYYLYSTTDIFTLGCVIGRRDALLSGAQNSFVFLDFGSPTDDGNGNYGTVLFDRTPISIAQIRSAVFFCSRLL